MLLLVHYTSVSVVCSVAVLEADTRPALSNDGDVRHLSRVSRAALEHDTQTVQLLLLSTLTLSQSCTAWSS